jgi:DNA-binding transcriptional LysR family regulator
MNVTLRQIRAFLAVADLGNFTRAASRLNMAQPALSLTIRELEAELGTRLFDRTTRRVELTAAGADFTQSARKLIDDLDLAMRNARELTERKRGRITVAAPPLLAAMILPGAIADFRRTFPGIDVRLVDTQSDRIVDKVRAGEADCGVGTFADDENGLERQMLVKDALMVFCDRKSPLSKARKVAWRALSDHPVIAMTRDSSIRLLAERGFEAAGQTLRPAFEVSQMTTAVMLVEAGLGVAVLPTYVWSFARDHKVISKPLVEPQVSREISLIHAAGRSLSPAAESFAPFLRKHAKLSLPRSASARGRSGDRLLEKSGG